MTDKAYNDSAIWVDFTKDDKPRHFRLGVFGALKVWNPSNIDPGKNPDFNKRLVVVKRPPFARNRWTHVAITHARLGTAPARRSSILTALWRVRRNRRTFEWEIEKGAIRLGVNYVGLMDDVAIFRRALTAREIASRPPPENGSRARLRDRIKSGTQIGRSNGFAEAFHNLWQNNLSVFIPSDSFLPAYQYSRKWKARPSRSNQSASRPLETDGSAQSLNGGTVSRRPCVRRRRRVCV